MTTRIIKVTLDKSGDPAVVLTNRSQEATANDTIKWQKQDNNDDFDIATLNPSGTGTAFSTPTVGGSGQNLSCTYTPTSSDPGAEFQYTLTVTSEGVSYDTTKASTQPDEGRPVIRN